MKSQPIDPMFVRCVKEELAAGERMVILCDGPEEVDRWRTRFTLEELELLSFEYPTPSQERR